MLPLASDKPARLRMPANREAFHAFRRGVTLEVLFSSEQHLTALAACLFLSLGAALNAASYPPVLSSNSVESALSLSDGQRAACDGVVVEKISAWSYPSYFVVCDGFYRASKLIMMCAPPSYLAHGQVVDVGGVLGSLPNVERCLYDPTVYAYIDQDRQLIIKIDVTADAYDMCCLEEYRGSITITATVMDGLHNPVPDHDVRFKTTVGSFVDDASPAVLTADRTTDSSGVATAVLYLPGAGSVTGTVEANDDMLTLSDDQSIDTYRLDREQLQGEDGCSANIHQWCGDFVRIVFCLDVTLSMRIYQSGEERYRQGIKQLVSNLRTANVPLLLGGIKFQDDIYDTKAMTADVDDFIDWLEAAITQ